MKPRSYGGHQILKQSWNAKTQMMLFLSTQDEQIIAKHFAECFSCCSASICKHLPSAKLCLGMSTDEHRYFLIGLFFIFKYGPSPAYFCLFSFFSNNLQNKNCRLQRDLISDRRNRRRTRWPLDHHHWPIFNFIFNLHYIHKLNGNFNYIVAYIVCFGLWHKTIFSAS